MEIKLEQAIFKSGVVGVCCKEFIGDGANPTIVNEYSIYRLRDTYSLATSVFLVESGKIKQELGIGLDFNINSDLVENPKTLDICDWQLLKIIHPEVKSFQWEVFQVMKDLVDNVIEEEIAINLIKNILEVS
jgi:hypothetical protein